MTVSKSPQLQILKHLYIEAAAPDSKLRLSLQELMDKALHQMGAFKALPTPLLDHVITFLDATSAYHLKFTCIAFRSLVEANLHQFPHHMPRFFALASLLLLVHSPSKDDVNHAIAIGEAKRGQFIPALIGARHVKQDEMRNWTYRGIAKEQAIRGNYDAARATLEACTSQENWLDAIVIIANGLAKIGEDTHALALAARLPLFDLGRKRRAYTAVALAQVRRGAWDLALATVAMIQPPSQEDALNEIHAEREKQLRLTNALKNPEELLDPTEKDAVYLTLTTNLAKVGKYQAAFRSALSIQSNWERHGAFKEIVGAQIAHGDLQAAFKTANEFLKKDYLKEHAYALIGSAYAQKGDFKNCLATLDLIQNDATRVEAYQQVITVLSRQEPVKISALPIFI